MKAPTPPGGLLKGSPAPCAAAQLHREERRGCRKRCYKLLLFASMLLLSSWNIFSLADIFEDNLPKIVRKGWAKPSADAIGDAYVSVARPFLVNLMKKAHRIGNGFFYPEYSLLGRAWFNALVVDLSEYILRRSTGVKEENFLSESSGHGQQTRSHLGTHWPAASSLVIKNGYRAAGEVVPQLKQSHGNGYNPRGTSKAEDSPPDDEYSTTSGQVLRLNKLTILRWKDTFDDIFMEVAKVVLPRHVLELVKSMDENQYSALRPTVEHALYTTLTRFYPTLTSPGTSESILPNYHVAVSSDTCPFSLYTSYTFMALVAARRSGVDALFLADEMMQHYKNDEPYISPECKAFNEYMTEALTLDSMTLPELVGRTAGAARKQFYNLRDLVSLEKETLLGMEVKSKDADKEDHELRQPEETRGNAALREMVVALTPEDRGDRKGDDHYPLNPRFIVDTFERINATTTKLPANVAMSTNGRSDENVLGDDLLARLILKEKASILGST